MNTIVRKETPDDRAAVFNINKHAFPTDAEARLVDALRANEAAFDPELSLVACADEQVIGHILFTRIRIENEQQVFESLALAPMAVLPDFQKSGIGSKLVEKGLETAKAAGYSSVIVLGHEHYYPKFGFQPASQWNIFPSFEVPDNVFMALELTPNGLSGVSGTVNYSEEFSAV